MPVAVTGLSDGVVAMSAGGSHTCAVTTAGEVLCWGSNLHAALGDRVARYSLVPAEVWSPGPAQIPVLGAPAWGSLAALLLGVGALRRRGFALR